MPAVPVRFRRYLTNHVETIWTFEHSRENHRLSRIPTAIKFKESTHTFDNVALFVTSNVDEYVSTIAIAMNTLPTGFRRYGGFTSRVYRWENSEEILKVKNNLIRIKPLDLCSL